MVKKRAAAKGGDITRNHKLESFAEDLGRMLGSAENKARSWLDQRKAIVTQLSQLRDKTDALLRELTEGGASLAVAVGLARGTRRGRPAGTAKTTTKKRQARIFTAEQREQQAERMRAYWAVRKAKTANKGRRKAKRGTAGGGDVAKI